ncbi:tail fiber assembly protein [Pseudomonas fitomaticsae]|uniref:Tail fiber assembly protein n=2 Tax=Pseudomonas fitomaticsae TaxID=2837969 RepID=A0ABY3QBH6_9PSED|nr:tail fiber assembly protein [Pseudomonas fitomaticsae]
MRDKAEADRVLAAIVAENIRRRTVADKAIAPLQDAVDIDDATDAEVALLKEWKKYRIALNRQPEEPGYPNTITWPTPPN